MSRRWILLAVLLARSPFTAAETRYESAICCTPAAGRKDQMTFSELKRLVEDAISLNCENDPTHNVPGYRSMVFVFGQFFGGEFQGLTVIGDNIVVGASAGARPSWTRRTTSVREAH